jgi:osmotically-inducible protein OsmY
MEMLSVVKDHPSFKIVHLATSLLQAKLYWAVNGISYEYDNGLLVLRGTLASYYHKRLAQETVRNLEGVRQVRNEIQVLQPVAAA